MDFDEELRKMIEQYNKEIKDKAINEFYAAIKNHYKVYKCIPSINFIDEIVEKLKGEYK